MSYVNYPINDILSFVYHCRLILRLLLPLLAIRLAAIMLVFSLPNISTKGLDEIFCVLNEMQQQLIVYKSSGRSRVVYYNDEYLIIIKKRASNHKKYTIVPFTEVEIPMMDSKILEFSDRKSFVMAIDSLSIDFKQMKCKNVFIGSPKGEMFN